MVANIIRLLRPLVVVIPLTLGACAGSYNGYVSAPPSDVQKVEQGGISEAALAQIAIVQNPDMNGGRIAVKAIQKIQLYAMSCQQQIDAQLAGPGQSAVTGAVPYGAAGAVGTGAGASLAFQGAVFSQYAIYGGVAYLLPGAVNGAVTGSYSMASAKGTCTRDFWQDIVDTDPAFKGTHIEVVYYGKAWGKDTPPALNHEAVVPAPPPRTMTPSELQMVGPRAPTAPPTPLNR